MVLMKRIINTLKYGNTKVKSILILTILAGLLTIGFIFSAIAFGKLIFFFGAVIGAFITISLAQTFGINEEVIDSGDMGKNESGLDEDEDGVLDTVMDDNQETAHTKKKKEKKIKEKKTKKEKVKKSNKKNKEVKEEQVDEEEQLDEEKQEDTEQNKETKENKKPTPITFEVLKTYNKKKIKRTKHKYRVKKEHRMVMIDRCEKLSIYQTPAYIWEYDNKLNMLLIEEEPRLITLPIFNLKEVTYLKKVSATPEIEYSLFKGNTLMAELFKPYIPDYLNSSVEGASVAYKNLYGIGPGIYFTNTSAKNLFEVTGLKFYVEDKVTTSNKVNYFFKEAYKSNILLRDNVIDANGYADRISNILEDMAKSTISSNEFKDTLNLMIKNKLITQEFATYYMEFRANLPK